MRLLTISSETHREGRKLFYSTNTFSFQDGSAPKQFLTNVPSDLVPHIQNVHLEMWMQGDLLDASSRTALWGTCLTETIAKDLVGLRSLNLTIYLGGYVTCWRTSQAAGFTRLFRSLRQLKQLKVFTVDILEDVNRHAFQKCEQLSHDEDAHKGDIDWKHQEKYWRRKEIMRQWAEDIRAVVLSKEEATVEGIFQGLSLT